MEKAIVVFAAINLLVMGLSHIFQHEAWAEFFARLHGLGRAGAFANGFLSLMMGSLIVAFHNVWSWPAVILTALGWSYVIKAVFVFLRPEAALRSMGRVTPENSRKFSVAGVFLVALGTYLAFYAWTA